MSAPTPAPPVDLLDCPRTGDLWLLPRGRLTADDCDALAVVLADRARLRRQAATEETHAQR